MFRSIGIPELLILFVLALLIYGIVMTIDAIRRPASQYRLGKKAMWVSLLVLTNPFLTRFAGGLIGLASLLVFVPAVVIYHSQNRWNNPIRKVGPDVAA
jgi:uncharacterized membrane protein YfcA